MAKINWADLTGIELDALIILKDTYDESKMYQKDLVMMLGFYEKYPEDRNKFVSYAAYKTYLHFLVESGLVGRITLSPIDKPRATPRVEVYLTPAGKEVLDSFKDILPAEESWADIDSLERKVENPEYKSRGFYPHRQSVVLAHLTDSFQKTSVIQKSILDKSREYPEFSKGVINNIFCKLRDSEIVVFERRDKKSGTESLHKLTEKGKKKQEELFEFRDNLKGWLENNQQAS